MKRVRLIPTVQREPSDAEMRRERRYSTLFERVGEGVGLVDAEESFSMANSAAENIFGLPPGGLLRRKR